MRVCDEGMESLRWSYIARGFTIALKTYKVIWS